MTRQLKILPQDREEIRNAIEPLIDRFGSEAVILVAKPAPGSPGRPKSFSSAPFAAWVVIEARRQVRRQRGAWAGPTGVLPVCREIAKEMIRVMPNVRTSESWLRELHRRAQQEIGVTPRLAEELQKTVRALQDEIAAGGTLLPAILRPAADGAFNTGPIDSWKFRRESGLTIITFGPLAPLVPAAISYHKK